MKKYETVAFDLDGTLTEPSSGLVASFAYALDKMGIEYYDINGNKHALSNAI